MCVAALAAADEELERRVRGGAITSGSEELWGDTNFERSEMEEEEAAGEETDTNATDEADVGENDNFIDAALVAAARERIETRRLHDRARAGRAAAHFAVAAYAAGVSSTSGVACAGSPSDGSSAAITLSTSARIGPYFADLTAVTAYSLCHGVSLREGVTQWRNAETDAAVTAAAPFQPGGVGSMLRPRMDVDVDVDVNVDVDVDVVVTPAQTSRARIGV